MDYPIKSDNDGKEGHVDPPVKPEDDDNRRNVIPSLTGNPFAGTIDTVSTPGLPNQVG